MDFGTLLHMAKKNSENGKDNNNKFYSTKYSPPKKVSKEKRLSENIQKFLQKREQEEKERQQEHRDKVAKLLAMRDEKSKNKIRKMLKVTKSANKSVLEDAINNEHTAVTLQGYEQPDADDYGYSSTEANAFYQKYIEKVQNIKEDKMFAPSRPQHVKDLSSTKERVKAAITRDIEGKNGSRLTNNIKELPQTNKNENLGHVRSSKRDIYDPEAEAIEERKRKEEVKKKQVRKAPPPPMDFQSLLKLAEKKQHEPIEIPVPVKKKEPERLLTLKEKKELENRMRAKEEKERKDKEQLKRPEKSNPKVYKEPVAANKTIQNPITRMQKPNQCNSKDTVMKTAATKADNNENGKKSLSKTDQNITKKVPISNTETNSSLCSKIKTTTNGYIKHDPTNSNSKAQVCPKDDIKIPKEKAASIRNNVPPSSHMKQMKNLNCAKKPLNNQLKRRILDDDLDSEYDSEMDDFIDDGDAEEDYSSHIKAIFGYDKSKYRYADEDDDDAAMESSFAQVQREEFISKKIGIQEDLEDMKLEAMEKKRKMMMKKRRL